MNKKTKQTYFLICMSILASFGTAKAETNVTFEADKIVVEQKNDVMVARGNLKITQKGDLLEADTITYDQVTGIAKATGGVRLKTKDGAEHLAEAIVLSQNFQYAVARPLISTLASDSHFSLKNVSQLKKKRTVFDRSVFPPCNCDYDKGQSPIWDLRASTSENDTETQTITHKNVRLRIFGLPILDLPVLALSDAKSAKTVSNEQEKLSLSIGNAAIINETSKKTTAKKSIKSQSINEVTVDDNLPPLASVADKYTKNEKASSTVRDAKVSSLSEGAPALKEGLLNETPTIVAPSKKLPQDTEISNTKYENKILELVQNSPEVYETLKNVGLSEWEIAKIKSETGFQLNASSSGGYRLASNLPRTHRRYSEEDKFVDLTIRLSKRLYDAGTASARIRAETKRKQAKVLEYNKALRSSFFTALRLGYLALSAKSQLTSIDDAIKTVKERRKSEEKRYLKGTGTSANLKELDLLAIDLITEKQVKNLELENSVNEFYNRFDANLEDYSHEIEKLNILDVNEKVEDIVHLLDAVKIFDYQLEALDQDIISTESSNKPQLNLNITTNLYDVQNSYLQNYELNGGMDLQFPIFDSGVQESNVRALATRKEIIVHQKQKETDRLLTKSETVLNTISNAESKIEASEYKINQIQMKLEQLKLRSSNMVASGLEIAKSEFRISALEREKMELFWNIRLAQAEKALIKETLISEL